MVSDTRTGRKHPPVRRGEVGNGMITTGNSEQVILPALPVLKRKNMDIAIAFLSSSLRNLAQSINENLYGSDTDFDEESFLKDLEDQVIKPLGHEIIKS